MTVLHSRSVIRKEKLPDLLHPVTVDQSEGRAVRQAFTD